MEILPASPREPFPTALAAMVLNPLAVKPLRRMSPVTSSSSFPPAPAPLIVVSIWRWPEPPGTGREW